jgi:hypothetical protein
MSKTAHPPAPWSYNRDEGGVHGHVISTGDYIICELPDAGDGAAPDTEAKARLIAAAPDLRQSSEELLFMLTNWKRLTKSYDFQGAFNRATAAIEIAKSKGGG